MNTQMERQGHQHHQTAELRSAGVEVEGGVHDHELGEEHEKKSVLKKVKAKAKKIKDTITKHGHGHPHHHHADDDDDDMEQGTEVHGAHNNFYESKEVQTHLPAQVGGGHHTKTSTAAPLAMGHTRTDANPEAKIEPREVLRSVPGQPAASIQHDNVVLGGGPVGITTAAIGNHRSDANPITTRQGHELSDYRSFIPEQVGVSSKHNGVTFGGSQTYPVGVGDHEPTNLPIISCLKKKREIFDTPTSQESDPHGPRGDVQPQNYHSLIEDPTRKEGGQEVGATPILHSLNKMAIFDDKSENHNAKASIAQQENVGRAEKDHHGLSSGTCSHDQFVSELLSYDARTFALNREQDTGFASGSVTEQDIGITGLSVSSATSLIADKAIQAKNAVASKLGYGGEGEGEHPNTTAPSCEGEDQAGKASSVTDYGKKVVSTVYNKVAGVGDALMPKTEDGTDKGVSTKDYIAGKVSPREEDKALSDVILEKMTGREEGKELSKEADHEGDDENKAEPSGKVTFSAKVARQLGTTNEERSEEESSGKTGPRGVLAETLRDTVTSWLGIGGDTGPSYVTYHDLPKEANEGN